MAIEGVVVVSAVKSYVHVAVDHNAAAVGVPSLIGSHAPRPKHMVLDANEDCLAELTMQYGSSAHHLTMTKLMCITARSAALAALARAPSVELLQDIIAIAHKARRLPHIVSLLSQLALIWP